MDETLRAQPLVPRAATDALRHLLLAFEARKDISFEAFKACWVQSELPDLLANARAAAARLPTSGGVAAPGSAAQGEDSNPSAEGGRQKRSGGSRGSSEGVVGEPVLLAAATSFLQGYWDAVPEPRAAAARSGDDPGSGDGSEAARGARAPGRFGSGGGHGLEVRGASGGGGARAGGAGGGARDADGWRFAVRVGALYALHCLHFCGPPRALRTAHRAAAPRTAARAAR